MTPKRDTRLRGMQHEKCGNTLVKVCYQANQTHIYPHHWQYCPNCDIMVRIIQQDVAYNRDDQLSDYYKNSNSSGTSP